MNALTRTDSLSVSVADETIVSQLLRWAAAAAGAYSPETERAWRQDLKSVEAFARGIGAQVLPAAPDMLAAYIRAESAAGRAVATIRRRIATVATVHRGAKLADPTKDEVVRLALRTISRERGTQQKQATGLTHGNASRIEGRVLGEAPRPKDLRDLALMLVGRDLMARASELVSVTVEAIAWEQEEDGTETALVSVRRHKTSTEALPYMVGSEAAAALRRWLGASGIEAGPVFVSLTKGGKPTGAALQAGDVNRIVKDLAERAGLEGGFSAHSLRVGMAQDLTGAGVDAASIMQAAGWQTPAMLTRYTRKLNAKQGAIAKYHARHK